MNASSCSAPAFDYDGRIEPPDKANPHPNPDPRYLAHGELYLELRRRVDAYFVQTGATPGAPPGMWAKTLLILGWLAASYGLLVLWASTPWQALVCSVSLGLAMAGVGLNIQHDGGHGA